MEPKPSAGRRKPAPTPELLPKLWERFMGEHGAAPFETAEGSDLVTGRSPHREVESGLLARNLRETLHSSVYTERLAAAWSALVVWFNAAFVGWCCSSIMANLPCAVHVLSMYIQHL
jgi:hypothetical protein